MTKLTNYGAGGRIELLVNHVTHRIPRNKPTLQKISPFIVCLIWRMRVLGPIFAAVPYRILDLLSGK
jgi:hypothetical protein